MGINPKSALLLLDFQNDFFEGGSAPIKRAKKRLVDRANEYIELFWDEDLPIFLTREWHTPDNVQFIENGGDWPTHCLQDTWGAEFHPELKVPKSAIVLFKGTNPKLDGLTAYAGRDKRDYRLDHWTHHLGVKHLYVGGMGLEYVVKDTLTDAFAAAITANLLEDITVSLERQPGDEESTMMRLLGRWIMPQTITNLRGRRPKRAD